MVKISYVMVQELFKELGINPYDFWVLFEGDTVGWFPDLPEREAKVSVDRLINLLERG